MIIKYPYLVNSLTGQVQLKSRTHALIMNRVKMNKNQAKHAGVQTLVASENDENQRLDNFLLKNLKGVPKSHLYRMLRKGAIRVNKGRKKPEYRLNVGDIVRIAPVSTSDQTTKQRIATAFDLSWFDAAIVYEDENLIVINKPAGIAVHSGSGIPVGLIDALKQRQDQYRKLELVHRLDRETSGCLVLAKKRSSLIILQEQFATHQTKKHYQMLVKGRWRLGDKTVNAPLQKFRDASGEHVVKVVPQGKNACTHFHLLKRFEFCSLLEADLETGRTHQLRVHSAFLGHPIAGDTKYGDKLFNRQLNELGLNRLFLHAASIEFIPPDHNSVITFEAPLPQILQAVLSQLENSQ